MSDKQKQTSQAKQTVKDYSSLKAAVIRIYGKPVSDIRVFEAALLANKELNKDERSIIFNAVLGAKGGTKALARPMLNAYTSILETSTNDTGYVKEIQASYEKKGTLATCFPYMNKAWHEVFYNFDASKAKHLSQVDKARNAKAYAKLTSGENSKAWFNAMCKAASVKADKVLANLQAVS